MGYLKGLSSPYFRFDPEGKTIFVFSAKMFFNPMNIFRGQYLLKGYILEDQLLEKRLRQIINIFNIMMFAGIIIIVNIISNFYCYNFFISILFGMFYSFLLFWGLMVLVKGKIKSLPQVEIAVTRKDSMRHFAKATGKGTITVMAVFSFLFILSGIFVIAVNHNDWPYALVGIIFFGLCFGIYLWMYYES